MVHYITLMIEIMVIPSPLTQCVEKAPNEKLPINQLGSYTAFTIVQPHGMLLIDAGAHVVSLFAK